MEDMKVVIIGAGSSGLTAAMEIAQKYVYGEHDALTDNQEIIDMTKDIEQAIAEQLILYGVSQQRELLIAFAKYMEEDKMYARHDEANVDDFLDNHSN